MTIKIYDAAGGSNNIEFMNNGDNEEDVMPLAIHLEAHKKDILYFNLSKEDAKEIIAYLKKEFKL